MYRMTDLVFHSGFSRHTIYKFRKLRLLPPPVGPRRGPTVEWTPDHLRILLELRRLREQRKNLTDEVTYFQTNPRFSHLYPAHERQAFLDDD